MSIEKGSNGRLNHLKDGRFLSHHLLSLANATSPDAATFIRRTASGLAVDCWDWPGAIRITKEWACCPAISNVNVSRHARLATLRPQPPHLV
ncbi:MAG: hypothetical protein AABO41_28280 [Acidobacteriota bacterium]